MKNNERQSAIILAITKVNYTLQLYKLIRLIMSKLHEMLYGATYQLKKSIVSDFHTIVPTYCLSTKISVMNCRWDVRTCAVLPL